MAETQIPLTLIKTTKATYLGYAKEEEKYVHLERAALIPEEITAVNDYALQYFAEKARRNLNRYDIPHNAIVEKTTDNSIDKMVEVYAELSKVANKQVAGRIKIARLKKFLGGKK